MHFKNPSPKIFVVSDSAGETGESVVKAAAVQFIPAIVDIRRIPFVSSVEIIDRTVEEAKSCGAVIVFTLVVPELRERLIQRAAADAVRSIDLLGPIMASLEHSLHREARHEPGIIHRLDEDYFEKVEAVEFAVKYDDGRDSNGILKADIVLVGVSRTSKTPLSMYLAHKKIKVANVPLVPELLPPNELFTVSKAKVFGLTIQPDKLNAIRRERLKTLGLSADAVYARMERIRHEVGYADSVMKRIGCCVIDVSDKAVEETAGIILDQLQWRS